MSSQSTPVISYIETLVKDVPGWTPIDQLYTLYTLIISTAHMEGDILEIGSWCGRSALVLGTAARAINSKVICIDLFPAKDDWIENADGTFSFHVNLNGNKYSGHTVQTVWKEPYQKDIVPVYEKFNSILDAFKSVMSQNSLTDIVTPFRGESKILEGMDNSIKLAFIDGDHAYEAVCADIKRVEDKLISGGWICFDDAFSHYEGVDKAITDLIINSGKYELQQQMTRKLFVARKK